VVRHHSTVGRAQTRASRSRPDAPRVVAGHACRSALTVVVQNAPTERASNHDGGKHMTAPRRALEAEFWEAGLCRSARVRSWQNERRAGITCASQDPDDDSGDECRDSVRNDITPIRVGHCDHDGLRGRQLVAPPGTAPWGHPFVHVACVVGGSSSVPGRGRRRLRVSVHIGVSLPDGEAVRTRREALRALGVSEVEWSDEPGYVSVKVRDPDGYVVEIAWDEKHRHT
jgi:hypothetical protein